jgi:hypothetical protein
MRAELPAAGPPLGEDGVVAFERAHGIRLPEPYRTFVSTEANGAAGPPAYGLLALGQLRHMSEDRALEPGALQRVFPLTTAWVWEDDPSASDEAIDEVYRSGILPLGTDGDGMDYVLVVTGPVRGQVWLVTDVGASPVAADFGRWLEGDIFPDATWTVDP